REAQADSAHAQEGILLAEQREACNGLVAAGVERTDDDGLARGPFDEPPVEPVLDLLVRKTVVEEEFGAGQADAVAGFRVQSLERRLAFDIDLDGDPRPRAADGRNGSVLRFRLGLRDTGALAQLELARGYIRGIDDQAAAFRIEHRGFSVRELLEVRAQADEQRHSTRSRQDGHVAGGAAAEQRGSPPARPVELEKTRWRQIVSHVDTAVFLRCRRNFYRD